MAKSPYDTDLDRNAANYVPLSPRSFIARSAAVFPDRPAVVHGDRTSSWAECYSRARHPGCALAKRGIGRHDPATVMPAYAPALLAALHAVARAGPVLNHLTDRTR